MKINEFDESQKINKSNKSKNINTLNKSKTIDELDKSKTIDKLDKSTTIDKIDKSKTINKLDKSKTIDELDKSKTIDELDKSKTIDELDESQIINQLNEKLYNIKKNTRDIQLRTQANIENVIKQTEQKKYQITQDNLKYFLETLSLNIDNLNIIINNTKNGILENHTIIQGLKLIIKSLSNTFKKFKKN